MREQKMTVTVPLQGAAMACGGKVLKGLVVLVGLAFGCGWFLENREFAWGFVMWAVSLGGSFWGAVSVGVLALAVMIWNGCVRDNAKDEYPEKIYILVLLSFAAIWFLAFLAGLRFSPKNFEDFSGYEAVGMVLLCAPILMFFAHAAGNQNAE